MIRLPCHASSTLESSYPPGGDTLALVVSDSLTAETQAPKRAVGTSTSRSGSKAVAAATHPIRDRFSYDPGHSPVLPRAAVRPRTAKRGRKGLKLISSMGTPGAYKGFGEPSSERTVRRSADGGATGPRASDEL